MVFALMFLLLDKKLIISNGSVQFLNACQFSDASCTLHAGALNIPINL